MSEITAYSGRSIIYAKYKILRLHRFYFEIMVKLTIL